MTHARFTARIDLTLYFSRQLTPWKLQSSTMKDMSQADSWNFHSELVSSFFFIPYTDMKRKELLDVLLGGETSSPNLKKYYLNCWYQQIGGIKKHSCCCSSAFLWGPGHSHSHPTGAHGSQRKREAGWSPYLPSRKWHWTAWAPHCSPKHILCHTPCSDRLFLQESPPRYCPYRLTMAAVAT